VGTAVLSNDRIKLTFPADITTNPMYVEGKQILSFKWKGAEIVPVGTVTLDAISSIPEVAASYTGYVSVASDGQITIDSSVPADAIPLVKVQGKVENNYTTRGGLRLSVIEDYRKLIDAEKLYRVSKDMTFAPLINNTGCTIPPGIILSSCVDNWSQVHSMCLSPSICSGQTYLNLYSLETGCCQKIVEFTPTYTKFFKDIYVCGTEYICCSETICGNEIICGDLCVWGKSLLGSDLATDQTAFLSKICSHVIPTAETYCLGCATSAWDTTYTKCLCVPSYVLSNLIPSAAYDLGSSGNRWGCIFTATLDITNNFIVGGNLCVGGNILPVTDNTCTVGSCSYRWNKMITGSNGFLLYDTIVDNLSITYAGCTGTITGSCQAQVTTATNIGVFVLQSGYVGINTIAPTTALTVNGTAKSTIACATTCVDSTCLTHATQLNLSSPILCTYSTGATTIRADTSLGNWYTSTVNWIKPGSPSNCCVATLDAAGNYVLAAYGTDTYGNLELKSCNCTTAADCYDPGDIIFRDYCNNQMARIFAAGDLCGACKETSLILSGTTGCDIQQQLGTDCCGDYGRIFNRQLSCGFCTLYAAHTDGIVSGYFIATGGVLCMDAYVCVNATYCCIMARLLVPNGYSGGVMFPVLKGQCWAVCESFSSGGSICAGSVYFTPIGLTSV
jgi:hypothetical protein